VTPSCLSVLVLVPVLVLVLVLMLLLVLVLVSLMSSASALVLVRASIDWGSPAFSASWDPSSQLQPLGGRYLRRPGPRHRAVSHRNPPALYCIGAYCTVLYCTAR